MFADNSAINGSCIGCDDRPCYQYGEGELDTSPLGGFPTDLNRQVCPTNVVSPNGDGGFPLIESDGCIMCGVCVLRCPVGAIFIDPAKGARVVNEDNSRFVKTEPDSAQASRTRSDFSGIERSGIMLLESEPVAKLIGQRSSKALYRNPRYPNILSRNLLVALGAKAVTPRAGVASTRMDLLYQTYDGCTGVAEVEFGDEAVLDAPRDILDDVAILVSRHKWDQSKIKTAIITDVLPNRRSEFWRLVADIRNVTGLRIGTMSVLSLMMAVWRGRKLDCKASDLFYTDESTSTYIATLVDALGFEPKLKLGGNRFVDWVK